MEKVGIVKCPSYKREEIDQSLEELLGLIGGLDQFIEAGDQVLLKVNLLMKRKPDRATTTHPDLVYVIAKKVIELGGIPYIADSPGGYNFWNFRTLWQIYETTGMLNVADELGIALNKSCDIIDAPYDEGKILKTVKTYKAVLNADKIINIPKVKTHMMTVYSGAVKNLFGIIPGGYKAEYHFRFEDVLDFSDLLIDVCQFAKPTLTIMDSIVGMEGYGPTAGKPKHIGLLMASVNPFLLDVVASQVIGLKPTKVPTIIKSIERGLYNGQMDSFEIVGEPIKDVKVRDYKIPTAKVSLSMYHSILPTFVTKWVDKLIKPYPKVQNEKCIGCGVCSKSCPAGCMAMVDIDEAKGHVPVIEKSGCIRCFCCHELCNVQAIDIHRSGLLRMILR